MVHAAGLTDKSRSHFDAQRFMEVGKAADPNIATGWLGRHLATVPPQEQPTPCCARIGVSIGALVAHAGGRARRRCRSRTRPTSYIARGARGAPGPQRLALLERD